MLSFSVINHLIAMFQHYLFFYSFVQCHSGPLNALRQQWRCSVFIYMFHNFLRLKELHLKQKTENFQKILIFIDLNFK